MASPQKSLDELMKPLNIHESDCTKCTKKKDILKFDSLNKYQRKAYNEIWTSFSDNNNRVITLDAPSGTGKTFLLSTFAATYDKPVQFIVFRKDQASDISCMGILHTYTYVSFNMHNFNLPYKHAIKMFNAVSQKDIGELYKLIVYAKKFVLDNNTDTIILDTYTIPPPAMLLLLYIVSLKSNLHLIFAGNGLQLGAVGKSPFHTESNFHIIQMLSDLTINKLDTNMRTCDSALETKILRFRKILRDYKPAGDVLFNFHLRYCLYCLFRPKYFTTERFDTVYIAQTHRSITSRLNRFIQHLQLIRRPYYEAPFYYRNKYNNFASLPTTRKGKFFPFLLLAEGYKYVYITERGVHHVVQLESLLFKNHQLDCVLVRFVNDKHVQEIRQCKLTYYQILPTYREWLLKDVIHTDELWQFPLRPYALTYHATLGRTLDKENVELSTDCPYANFLYIGLCSVRHYYDIHKIHAEQDLLGFVITEYMENERNDSKYYYRCPFQNPNTNKIMEYISTKGPNNFIDGIEWIDTDDIYHFESKKLMSYVRIKRDAYNQAEKEMNTPLMKITRFVKDNPKVILTTMNMAAANDFTGQGNTNNNKKKKKKNQGQESEKPKESDAYVYLNDKYTQWIDSNEKN